MADFVIQCGGCGSDVVAHTLQKKFCGACLIARNKTASKKYNKTEKGRARVAKHNDSESGKASAERYSKTEKHRARVERAMEARRHNPYYQSEENKEYIRKRGKSEAFKEYQKKWSKTPRGLLKDYTNNTRRRCKDSGDFGAFKLKMKQEEPFCNKCGCQYEETFNVDHVIPIRMSQDNSWKNLQALCNECHKVKTAAEAQMIRDFIALEVI